MYKDPRWEGTEHQEQVCVAGAQQKEMGRGALYTGQRLAPGLHSSPHGHREPSRVCKQEEGRLVKAELWSDDVTHVSNALSRCKGTRATAARKQATGGVSFGWEATTSL